MLTMKDGLTPKEAKVTAAEVALDCAGVPNEADENNWDGLRQWDTSCCFRQSAAAVTHAWYIALQEIWEARIWCLGAYVLLQLSLPILETSHNQRAMFLHATLPTRSTRPCESH